MNPTDAELIWITDVCSKDAYTASFSLASVSHATTKVRPLIAGIETIAETPPWAAWESAPHGDASRKIARANAGRTRIFS